MINYMMDSCKDLHENEIMQVEAVLGLTLPSAYKNFLQLHNGGRPYPDSFPIQIEHLGTQGKVDVFLCINDDDLFDLITWVKRYQTRVPEELIPVAVDPGGNLICLGVKGKYTEQVLFWDHENEAPEGEDAWFKNVYLVGHTFDAFIAGFQ